MHIEFQGLHHPLRAFKTIPRGPWTPDQEPQIANTDIQLWLLPSKLPFPEQLTVFFQLSNIHKGTTRYLREGGNCAKNY